MKLDLSVLFENAAKILIIFGFIIFIISYIRVILIERKIKSLYYTIDVEEKKLIEDSRGRGILRGEIEARKNNIHKKYQPDIDKLERDRRYILAKLPLFKK